MAVPPAAAAPPPAPPARVNSAKVLLAQAIQAPDSCNVDSALRKLAALGVLESAEDTAEVTPFGRLLAAFPGDLALGKVVALGSHAELMKTNPFYQRFHQHGGGMRHAA